MRKWTSNSQKNKAFAMSIHLILGPMFSGKTTELMRWLERAEIAGRRVLTVRFQGDARYSESAIATHAGSQRSAVSGFTLQQIMRSEAFASADVIGIDEGQFFDDFAERSLEFVRMGKTLIIAALNGTYERKQWSTIGNLLPCADRLSHLTAVCMRCGADAPFTGLLVAPDPTDQERSIHIGGKETYLALCGACWRAGVSVESDE